MANVINEINWLAVLLGGVIYMIVGGLWYGPIAGKAWLAEVGLTEEEIKAAGSPAPTMIKSFIAALFLSFGLAFLFIAAGMAEAGPVHGAITGAFLAIFVTGAASFPNYAFESKTMRHFLIHLGNTTISMTLIGAMIAAWR
jgi:hypothetical protein